MNTRITDEETVVLLEPGVSEPRALLGSVSPRAIIREAAYEPEATLLARLHRHFAELAASGMKIRTAVLVCNEGDDNALLLARARIVCRLLKHMSDASPARLVLCTLGRQASVVNGLLALGGALIESWVGAGVVVEVRQAEASAEQPRRRELSGGGLPPPWFAAPLPQLAGIQADVGVADRHAE